MKKISLKNILTRIYNNIFYLSSYVFIFIIAFSSLYSFESQAAGIISDEEVETVVKEIAKPILMAANVSPEEINFYIVLDPDVNAFVYGGRNIFINTGLITLFNDPDVLKGVIAHELGHITGGHIARREEQIKRLFPQFVFTNLLGVAALLGGSGELGSAILSGSSHGLERSMLRHSRENESSADQAAFQYLQRSHNSNAGLLKLLQYFQSQKRHFDQLTPYASTHPIDKERISAVKLNVANVPNNYHSSDKEKKQYSMIVAKLRGFIESTGNVLKYNQKDLDPTARQYELAVALFRKPDLKAALAKINELILEEPKNPYFQELKGQMLFENGYIREAAAAYKIATELLPNSYLIKSEYAVALINDVSSKNNGDMQIALKILQYVAHKQPNSPLVYRNLAIAYGKLGNLGYSNLMLAEEAILLQNYVEAKKFIYNSKKYVTKDQRLLLKIEDLEKIIDEKIN
jgi:predicted Zn-dependent protease